MSRDNIRKVIREKLEQCLRDGWMFDVHGAMLLVIDEHEEFRSWLETDLLAEVNAERNEMRKQFRERVERAHQKRTKEILGDWVGIDIKSREEFEVWHSRQHQ